MNNVILSGRLVKDVELRYTQGGKAVASFTIAVQRDKDTADFIKVSCWDKQAEAVSKFLAKGSETIVQGSIRTGSYEKDGQKVYTTEVVANKVEFVGKRVENEHKSDAIQETFGLTDEQVPF